MKNYRSMTLAAADYTVRHEELNGIKYLVVPVVALVEGVVHASNAETPELVTAEEFTNEVDGWIGMPLYHGHPQDEKGHPVSGRLPAVRKRSLGMVMNPGGTDKLKMEAWFQQSKLETLAPELLKRLQERKPIQVSVGVLTDTLNKPGTRDGKAYGAVWQNIVPDHLAILPESQAGACDWDMGCGIRAAKGAEMEHCYAAWLEAGPETDELLRTLRNISQEERDKMSASDFAGKDKSFPIAIPGDVHDAAASIGRAGPGNYSPDMLKRRIIAIAYRKGSDFVAQLPESWKKTKDQKNASLFAKLVDTLREAMSSAEEIVGEEETPVKEETPAPSEKTAWGEPKKSCGCEKKAWG